MDLNPASTENQFSATSSVLELKMMIIRLIISINHNHNHNHNHNDLKMHPPAYRFEAFETEGSFCVDGSAEVERRSATEPARLKAEFTAFSLEFGGQER